MRLFQDLLAVRPQSWYHINDEEKVFDRVEDEYSWQTLSAFGFSPAFIDKVKVLYCEIQSVLKINSGMSAPFQIQKGS